MQLPLSQEKEQTCDTAMRTLVDQKTSVDGLKGHKEFLMRLVAQWWLKTLRAYIKDFAEIRCAHKNMWRRKSLAHKRRRYRELNLLRNGSSLKGHDKVNSV